MSTDSTEIPNRSGKNQSLGWRLKTFCGKSEAYAQDSRLPLKIEMFNTTSNCSAEDRKGSAEKNKKPRRTPRLPPEQSGHSAENSNVPAEDETVRLAFRNSCGTSGSSAENFDPQPEDRKLLRRIWKSGERVATPAESLKTSANFHDFSWQFKTSAEVLNCQRKIRISRRTFKFLAEVFIFQLKS